MSKKFVISSGHGDKVAGAMGIIDEHKEAKKVVDRVFDILTKEYDVEGYKYHETTALTQDQNLANIVHFHNSKDRVLDIAVHFNSASPQATGSECCYYSEKSLADDMSKAMAGALDIADRGAKERKELYFLRLTDKPAILLEVCFVTSKKDTDSYKKNFEKLCQAIAGVVAHKLGYTKKVVTPVKKSQKSTKSSYYTKLDGKFEIIKECYAYRTPRFDIGGRTDSCKVGEVFTAVGVVRIGTAYRVRTKSGLYITANKDFIKPL